MRMPFALKMFPLVSIIKYNEIYTSYVNKENVSMCWTILCVYLMFFCKSIIYYKTELMICYTILNFDNILLVFAVSFMYKS